MSGEEGVQVWSIYEKEDEIESGEVITNAVHMGGIIRLEGKKWETKEISPRAEWSPMQWTVAKAGQRNVTGKIGNLLSYGERTAEDLFV